MGARPSRRSLAAVLTSGLVTTLPLATADPAIGRAAGPGGGQASTASTAFNFVSAPHLHPPKLRVLERRPGLARGDFLLTSTGGRGTEPQPGPLIVDSRLRPVWFRNIAAGLLVFQQEMYHGHPVLVWVQTGPVGAGRPPRTGHPGPPTPGDVRSRVVVLDEHYRRIATVQARSPWTIDPHDVSIIGDDIWVPVDRLVRHQDLTPYGGLRNAAVLDVGLQEYLLKTGRLIHTWDALNPHRRPGVPLSASHERSAPVWDAYHLNSVQALPDGDILVSMRNTWAVYLIDPATDRIVWTLGGTTSTFGLGRRTRFAWQHDARLLDPGSEGMGSDVELSLFNDNTQRGQAEGMILRLDTVTHRAALVAAYRHRPQFVADFEGSMQALPNGDALVGWGSPYAYFTEFSKSGRELLDVRCPLGDDPYRVVLTDQWVGTPYYPPSGAVRGQTVYASWNGATEVASWEVLARSNTGRLGVVARHHSTGFETAIRLSSSYPGYVVRALDDQGRTLGTSRSFG